MLGRRSKRIWSKLYQWQVRWLRCLPSPSSRRAEVVRSEVFGDYYMERRRRYHGHRSILYTSNGACVRATRSSQRHFRAGSNADPRRKHLGLARPPATEAQTQQSEQAAGIRRDKIAARLGRSSGGPALSTASASVSRVTPGSYGAWRRIIPPEPLRAFSVVRGAERPAATGDPCKCKLPAW